MQKTKEKNLTSKLLKTDSLKQLAAVVITIIFTVIATRSTILGYLSPLNVVVGAVSGIYLISAFASALICYLVMGELRQGLFQLIALIFIFLTETLLSYFNVKRKNILVDKAFVCTFSMLASAFVTAAFSPFDGQQLAYRVIFSLLSGCLVFFLNSTKNRADVDGMLDLNGTNGACAAIIYILFITTLSSAEIFNLNLGVTFASIVILFAAKKYRHIGGAVCGALTTCAVLVYSPELAKNTLLLSVSGLLAGALSPFGTVVTAIAFVLASVVGLLAAGFEEGAFSMLVNFAVGAVIFTALPENFLRRLLRYVGGSSKGVFIVGQTASSRLKFASGTLKDVRKRLLSISDTLEKKKTVAPLSQRVRFAFCKECKNFENCWKSDRQLTTAAFLGLEKQAQKQGVLTLNDVMCAKPDCILPLKLCDSLNSEFFALLAEKSENRKITDLREMLLEQLLAMEDLLSDLSYKVEKITEVDAALSERVRRYLTKQGYNGVRVCVYSDDNSVIRTEVFSLAPIEGDMVRLTVDIGTIIDCELDMPLVSKTEGICRLLFCPRPDCEIKSGICQLIGKGETVSGDTLERIWLSRTEYAVILSDGMGRGKRAKLDSSFAVTLVSRLLASGISPETSFKLINSILRVKGWDESFATADLVIVDLSRKTARFVKAGAAPSFISRGREMVKIEESSFPLGILSANPPACREIKLIDGDRIIVISDGVSQHSVVKAADEFVKLSLNPTQTAELIASIAEKEDNKYVKNMNNDDISVCVLDIFVNK